MYSNNKNLHQLLRNSVPTPTHLRSLAHVSQVAQHAAIANLRSFACLVSLVLYVWANIFEDALQDVFVQALGEVASSADWHVWNLAGGLGRGGLAQTRSRAEVLEETHVDGLLCVCEKSRGRVFVRMAVAGRRDLLVVVAVVGQLTDC